MHHRGIHKTCLKHHTPPPPRSDWRGRMGCSCYGTPIQVMKEKSQIILFLWRNLDCQFVTPPLLVFGIEKFMMTKEIMKPISSKKIKFSQKSKSFTKMIEMFKIFQTWKSFPQMRKRLESAHPRGQSRPKIARGHADREVDTAADGRRPRCGTAHPVSVAADLEAQPWAEKVDDGQKADGEVDTAADGRRPRSGTAHPVSVAAKPEAEFHQRDQI